MRCADGGFQPAGNPPGPLLLAQVQRPFWKRPPPSSPAPPQRVSAHSPPRRRLRCSSKENAGCLPTGHAPPTRQSPTPAARCRADRLFRSSMISSSTNVTAAIGVLKAAASPAAAPAAVAAPAVLFCLAGQAGQLEASAAGHLHARALPGPGCSRRRCSRRRPRNFTQTARHGMTPKSFQNASLSCGMPLPGRLAAK